MSAFWQSGASLGGAGTASILGSLTFGVMLSAPFMATNDERFGVRLVVRPGLSPEAVADLSRLLAPIAATPADVLQAALARGPYVLDALLDEPQARQLVLTFRDLGATAELVEAIDPVRPLFSTDEQKAIGGGWRHVVTQSRLATSKSTRVLSDTLLQPALGDLPATGELSKRLVTGAIFQRPTASAPRDTVPFDMSLLEGHVDTEHGPADVEDSGATQSMPVHRQASANTLLMATDLSATRPFLSALSMERDKAAAPPPFAAPDEAPPTVDPFASPAMSTLSIGSLAVGPKVFQLATPAPSLSETGHLVRPAQLSPFSEVVAADSTPRHGVYRLPPHRTPPQQQTSQQTPVTSEDVGPRPEPAPTPIPKASPPARDVPAATTQKRAPVAVRPLTRRQLNHQPLRAAFLSAVVPGLGQLYNGQRERAVLVALGTPLMVPYFFGILDAFRFGRKVNAGLVPAPDPGGRRAAYPGQVALGLAIVLSLFVAVHLAFRLAEPAPAIVMPPDLAAVEAPPTMAPPPPETPPSPRQALGDGLDVPMLMRKGRMACERGLYAECEEIMHEVISRDPSNREAYTLLIEATARRRAQKTE